MNRLCILAAASALCLLPFQDAQAQTSRLYLAGYMGLNVHPVLDYSENLTPANGEVEVKNGLKFAGALGLRLTKKLAFEAELGYARADMDNLDVGGGETKIGGQLRTTTLMLSGVYNFDTYWDRVNPFVTAGLGLAWHDGKVEDLSGASLSSSDSDMALAWAMGGGLRYQVREGLAFTGSYRYLGTTEIGLENTTIDYGAHEFRVGLHYDLYQ